MTGEANSVLHYRRSLRLKRYDYSQTGAYFVTICSRSRECILGRVDDGEMRLNDAGRMVQSMWEELPARFSGLELDAFVVMPNHIHGIIVFVGAGLALPCKEGACRGESRIRPDGCREPNSGDHKDRPYGTTAGSLGRIIQAFKSMVTHEYVMGVRQQRWASFRGRLWQRNYYEHIVRDEDDMNHIRQYIIDNPSRWAEDENNPEHLF
jgi:REP element-mobilizing transposase RayT